MNSLNILNAKQLERQMKLVESRMAELQKEIDQLEKMRIACQILMGGPAEFLSAEREESKAAPAPAPSPAKKTASGAKSKVEPAEILAKVTDLLQGNAEGLSVEEILDELREQQISLKRPALETILRKFPLVVTEAGEGVWMETQAVDEVSGESQRLEAETETSEEEAESEGSLEN